MVKQILTNWQEKEERKDEYYGSWLFRVIDKQRRKHAAEVQTRTSTKFTEIDDNDRLAIIIELHVRSFR